MSKQIEPDHPLRDYFRNAVHWSLHERLGLRGFEDVEAYVTQLLVSFLHVEAIFAIKDKHGRPLESVYEMLPEADVRLNADSFEREREVHRHIGDFLLFWTGVFPDHYEHKKGAGALAEAIRQGKESYFIVSSFRHVPYDAEAPTFQKLSGEFEACREGLTLVRSSFEGIRKPGWDGLAA